MHEGSNEAERIARLEALVENLRREISDIRNDLKLRDRQTSGWLRGIGSGIIILFVTSMVNFVVWLLGKVPH